MPVFPVPMIVALILGFLFAQSLVHREKPWLFLAFIAACSLQSVIISLNQYYGFTGLRFIQPVTATFIPPLAYVTFQASAVRPLDRVRDLLHLAAPAFTAFYVFFAIDTLDYVVFAVFAAYGLALLIQLQKGRDSLLLTRLESGELPLLIWRVIAIALLVSALSDALIILDQTLGQGELQPWIISLFSSLTLLTLGALSLSRNIEGAQTEEAAEQVIAEPHNNEADMAIIERLDDLVSRRELYLDPGLTLSQLSRKLGIPAKQLSTAINRGKGENVSRYINAYRIAHACERLAAGDNVTTAMLSSGFNTKSNFNREFHRTMNCTPREWLDKTSPGKSD